jgi:hypothetical protein
MDARAAVIARKYAPCAVRELRGRQRGSPWVEWGEASGAVLLPHLSAMAAARSRGTNAAIAIVATE